MSATRGRERGQDHEDAMRDASGWNTADPTPTRATANKIAESPGAIESKIKPAALDAMPIGIA